MGKTWKDNKHNKFDNYGRDNKFDDYGRNNKQKIKLYDCNNCNKDCSTCPKSIKY